MNTIDNDTLDRLAELCERLRTQSNDCTGDPIFVVFQKDRVYGIDVNYEPETVWISQCGDYVEATPEEVVTLEALDNAGEPPQIDGCEYEKVGYVDKDRFCTACFTRKGAEAYIAANGHNLTKPHIYVETLYRNREMIELRNILPALIEQARRACEYSKGYHDANGFNDSTSNLEEWVGDLVCEIKETFTPDVSVIEAVQNMKAELAALRRENWILKAEQSGRITEGKGMP